MATIHRAASSAQRDALAPPQAVAEHLGVPVATLKQWRYLRKGPRFIKVGNHVRYRWADVESWLREQARGGDAA